MKVKDIATARRNSGVNGAQEITEACIGYILEIVRCGSLVGKYCDCRGENGIMPHRYGSHIFHAPRENVWHRIRRISCFNAYMHKAEELIDGIETFIYINIYTMSTVLPLSLPLEVRIMDSRAIAEFLWHGIRCRMS